MYAVVETGARGRNDLLPIKNFFSKVVFSLLDIRSNKRKKGGSKVEFENS
jgi:hypothetical protein